MTRITQSSALELAIALCQYFYYELDNPIMPDSCYDDLEKRYKNYREQTSKAGGIYSDILEKPGSPQQLKEWFKRYNSK